MGSCLSKKSVCVSSSYSSSIAHSNQPERDKSNTQLEKNKAEEETVKKEIFVIKHRKSHDSSLLSDVQGKRDVEKGEESGEKSRSVSGNSGAGNVVEITAGGGVRTSSCTKEELDAILIQCGRLSRSSSTGNATSLSENCGKKYSGSKRSFDFDTEGGGLEGNGATVDGDDRDGVAGPGSESRRHRNRSRQPSGRRRTPSRERERRVSRSPGRRSESPAPTGGPNSCPAISSSKPVKMVSVPATDKSGNGCAEPDLAVAVKRIQVKRNAGGDGDGAVASRTASSPRTQSPARIKASSENQNVNSGQVQQPLPLSRSNSRKADISPYRRNPLGEIDTNVIPQTPQRKQNADTKQGAAENKLRCSNPTNSNCKTKNVTHVNVITSATEGLQLFHSVVRSRSSRLSRELDINPETLSNPVVTSYTSLLLEDIQNFHQKNAPPVDFSLPPCVTKACSILEAVADLNSTTSSNFSSAFSEDRQRNPVTEQFGKSNETDKPTSLMESEVVVDNDLMDPTFHKYVTVGRGAVDVDEFEEQESSGSNSFTVGGQQNWICPSSWEPNSVDSSRSVKRQHEVRHVVASDSGKGTSSKKREFDNQRSGIGRGRIGSRGAQKAAT